MAAGPPTSSGAAAPPLLAVGGLPLQNSERCSSHAGVDPGWHWPDSLCSVEQVARIGRQVIGEPLRRTRKSLESHSSRWPISPLAITRRHPCGCASLLSLLSHPCCAQGELPALKTGGPPSGDIGGREFSPCRESEDQERGSLATHQLTATTYTTRPASISLAASKNARRWSNRKTLGLQSDAIALRIIELRTAAHGCGRISFKGVDASFFGTRISKQETMNSHLTRNIAAAQCLMDPPAPPVPPGLHCECIQAR